VLLGGQLAFIVLQRGIVDDQRHIAVRQEDRSAPVLDTAKALLGSPDDAMAAAREAGDTLRQLRRVLRAALDEDLVGVTTGALRRAPQLLSAVDHAVAVLDRTYPTLRASLVTQRESLAIQRRTLALLERSLAVQRGTQAIAGETRDIARATLGHTESIDTKTGGQAPAGVVP
jgi:hypothetical protein